MSDGSLIKMNGNGDNKVSNWDKPGGTLGMIVAAAVVAGVLYKALPYLVAITWNLVSIACGVGILLALYWLFTDKTIGRIVSTMYFMTMRKITGLIIEIDPIAIVEMRVLDMKKKIQQISKTMGDLKGLIRTNEQRLKQKQADYSNQLIRMETCEKNNNRAQGQVARNQAVRLDGVIKAQKERLENSKKWYEVLSKLEEMANLTVEDTENEVAVRKEEFKSIRAQHKAFKSVMSIMKGDPDDMAMFQQAMDFMASDMNAKLGEMEHVLDSTGGLLAQYSLDNDVTNSKADALLKKYEEFGIDGMFDNFNTQDVKSITNSPNIPLGVNTWKLPETVDNADENKKNKYF